MPGVITVRRAKLWLFQMLFCRVNAFGVDTIVEYLVPEIRLARIAKIVNPYAFGRHLGVLMDHCAGERTRSRPRLTARPTGLARSGFLVLPQSQ